RGLAHALQPRVELGRGFHDSRPVGKGAGLLDLWSHHPAVAHGERLPLEGEQPVALQIPEGAVITEHVEAVGRPLEGAPGLVTAILARADIGLEDSPPL